MTRPDPQYPFNRELGEPQCRSIRGGEKAKSLSYRKSNPGLPARSLAIPASGFWIKLKRNPTQNKDLTYLTYNNVPFIKIAASFTDLIMKNLVLKI
jgi:hypothetical protein